LISLAPQAVVLFVLLGPGIVLISMAFSIGRSTKRGLSVRYVLRFASIDAVLLALASLHQIRTVGALLPERARFALLLMVSSLALASVYFVFLVFLDWRRPGSVRTPAIIAGGLALITSLGVAADLRRVRVVKEVPVSLPGFEMRTPLALLELPGLGPGTLDTIMEEGHFPSVLAVHRRGTRLLLDGTPLGDPLAWYATLITGRDSLAHGVLGPVRYRPWLRQRSFGIFPRGLLLRPLLFTPLWSRVPLDADAQRAVDLAGIAGALDIPVAVLGDPLERDTSSPARWIVHRDALRPGGPIPLPQGGEIPCPDPGDLSGRYFDPPARDLPVSAGLARLVRDAASQDRCVLEAGKHALRSDYPIVHMRLDGLRRVLYHFTGWNPKQPARGVTSREIEALRWAVARYIRDLDAGLAEIISLARDRYVAVVSTHGTKAQRGFALPLRVLSGGSGATGSHAGPPPGFLLLTGPGVRRDQRLDRAFPIESVLPTLLWAAGLPLAENMGPISDLTSSAFTPEFIAESPMMSIPTYADPPKSEPSSSSRTPAKPREGPH